MAVKLSIENVRTVLMKVEHVQKHGILFKCVLRNVCDRLIFADVYADTWPDYNGICICNERFQESGEPEEYTRYRYIVYVASAEPMNLDWLLGITAIEQPTLAFIGTTVHLVEPLRSMFAGLGRQLMPLPLYPFLVDNIEDIPLIQLPDGYEHTTLKPEDAHIVNNTWKFGKTPTSEIYIRHCIEGFPSIAVKDVTSGKIIAGFITYHISVMGALWVDSEHQGRGLAKFAITTLARTLMQLGHEACIFAETDHHVSMRLHEKCGFRRVEGTEFNSVLIETSTVT